MDSITRMEICIKGGKFLKGGDTCLTSQPLSSIVVIWDMTSREGSLTIKAKTGKSSIKVNVILPLNGGRLDTSTKTQSIDYNSTAGFINCGPASGGACSPVYEYQWQQSDNCLVWNNIPGSNGQNLKLAAFQMKSLFVRRKTKERISGTIEYSDIGAIYVGPNLTP